MAPGQDDATKLQNVVVCNANNRHYKPRHVHSGKIFSRNKNCDGNGADLLEDPCDAESDGGRAVHEEKLAHDEPKRDAGSHDDERNGDGSRGGMEEKMGGVESAALNDNGKRQERDCHAWCDVEESVDRVGQLRTVAMHDSLQMLHGWSHIGRKKRPGFKRNAVSKDMKQCKIRL